jgi:TetR/AcrR family transcriptional regulator, transcriptional repressor for nem operon
MRKKEKGRKTRQMIVDKSLQLFSVKGYHSTSINDILQETHLTKGGLYSHFKSKEQIWYSCYDKAVEMWRSIIFPDMRTLSDPYERILLLISRHLNDYVGKNIFQGGGFFLNMLIEFSGQSEEKANLVLQGFTRYTELIESWLDEAIEKGLIRPDVNSKEVSSFIVSSFYGTTVVYTASKDREIIRRTVSQLRFYLNSLTPVNGQ